MQADEGGRGDLPGVIVARRSVLVKAETTGRIVATPARVGDLVERGTPLVVLDGEELQIELAMAQASLRAALAEQRRAEWVLSAARDKAHRRGLHPELYPAEELTAYQAAAGEAEAALEENRARVSEQSVVVNRLRARVARAVVTSPLGGRVAELTLDKGAVVTAGTTVARVISDEDLLIRFAVPPQRGDSLRVGGGVTMRVDALELDVAGRLSWIAPEIDPASQMIRAEAEILAPQSRKLRHGMVGRLALDDAEPRPASDAGGASRGDSGS